MTKPSPSSSLRFSELLIEHLGLDRSQVRAIRSQPGGADAVVVEWEGRASVDHETFGRLLAQARAETRS